MTWYLDCAASLNLLNPPGHAPGQVPWDHDTAPDADTVRHVRMQIARMRCGVPQARSCARRATASNDHGSHNDLGDAP